MSKADMWKQTIERCYECAQATGNAGILDGSLYFAGKGPYCEGCYKDVIEQASETIEALNTRTSDKLAEAIAELEQDLKDGRGYLEPDDNRDFFNGYEAAVNHLKEIAGGTE